MIPSIYSLGTPATGLISAVPAFPAGPLIANNTVLLLEIATPGGAGVPTVSPSGGTWTPIVGSGSGANAGIRGTWLWSRYNGTQTAPTVTAASGFVHARIVAVQDCITTGDVINAATVVEANTFAQTTSNSSSITTTSGDCLVVVGIVGDGPDADGTDVFTTFVNANLSSLTEVYDQSFSTDVGGSIGMASGGKALAGAVGITAMTHLSVRTAFKQFALTPAVVTPTDIFRAGRVPVRIAAAGAGVTPIRSAPAGAGVVPIVTTTSTDAGVVPVRIAADEAGVVPTVETP